MKQERDEERTYVEINQVGEGPTPHPAGEYMLGLFPSKRNPALMELQLFHVKTNIIAWKVGLDAVAGETLIDGLRRGITMLTTRNITQALEEPTENTTRFRIDAEITQGTTKTNKTTMHFPETTPTLCLCCSQDETTCECFGVLHLQTNKCITHCASAGCDACKYEITRIQQIDHYDC